MWLLGRQRKQINEYARQLAGSRFLRCEVVTRYCDVPNGERETNNLMYAPIDDPQSAMLANFERLADFVDIDEHPSEQALLNVYVFVRDPDVGSELYSDFMVHFNADGEIDDMYEYTHHRTWK